MPAPTHPAAKAAQNPSVPPGADGIIDLMAYFSAPRFCRGFVEDMRGQMRRFTAEFKAQAKDDALLIDEQMIYEDGERFERCWQMIKADGGWSARAEDVVGKARIIRAGSMAAIWLYRLDHAGKSGTIRVGLRDHMVLLGDGLMASDTKITKFGLPIARVWALYSPL
ncbi:MULTISPECIES: DUF3833 family protein [unclassified Iodidimonas]|jgi:hypothetical protein|uniref:DUF3833 family protein n=1 Tax=unclassified Iodidimonas TaxID=2626145 RepID=UPI0024824766|nr:MULTISPECIES: DUF3833 family protein [unclassified Iodidimonas]